MDYPSRRQQATRTKRGFMRLGTGRDIPPGQESYTRRSGSSAYKLHASICVALHFLLILLHIGLLFIYFGQYEHSISFAITPFTVEWYPLAVTTIMQVFGTILLAVLVMYTQSLAFQSDLYVHQTLTSLHDKSNAWLGLGAACASLWNQFKLRAAMVGVVYITAYLFGLWLLHITIPTVLNVVPYNATVPTVFRTALANSLMNADYASAYDILLVYDQVPTLGLQDNMVYDVIPPVPSANGTTTVNGSVYNVDCAALPSVQQPIRAYQTLDRGGQPNMTWLSFLMDTSVPDGTWYSATIPYMAPVIYTGQVVDMGSDCDTTAPIYTPGNCWAPILILSTVSIVDSSGSEAPVPGGPWRLIDPQVIVPIPVVEPAMMITGLQLIACSVNITNVKVDVSVNTRMPAVKVQKPLPQSVWKNWTWPEAPVLTDQLRIAQSATYFSPPSGHSSSYTVVTGSSNGTETAAPVALPGFELEAFQVAPVDENPIPNEILKSSSTKTVNPTAFDVFLNEDLRILADNRTNVTLAEINHSLERALAATFWYGNQVNYSSSHAIAKLSRPDSIYTSLIRMALNLTSNGTDTSHAYGEATITVPTQRLRLNLSLAPIVVGLAASLGLLVLCILVTHVHPSAREAFDPKIVVDSGGLLQYTWLLGNEPHLADVASPELDNLRAAGMFTVQMGDEVKKRLSSRASTFTDLPYEDLAYAYEDPTKEPLYHSD